MFLCLRTHEDDAMMRVRRVVRVHPSLLVIWHIAMMMRHGVRRATRINLKGRGSSDDRN